MLRNPGLACFRTQPLRAPHSVSIRPTRAIVSELPAATVDAFPPIPALRSSPRSGMRRDRSIRLTVENESRLVRSSHQRIEARMKTLQTVVPSHREAERLEPVNTVLVAGGAGFLGSHLCER